MTTKAKRRSISRREVDQLRCSHCTLHDFTPPPPLVAPDYSKGFGGKYGVEKEKVDRAAVGYDYEGRTEKHQSQKGDRTLMQWHSSGAQHRCNPVESVQIIQQVSKVDTEYNQNAWTR